MTDLNRYYSTRSVLRILIWEEMQSLSDFPNVQLKSDIIQMILNQMPLEETIPFSAIDGPDRVCSDEIFWLVRQFFRLVFTCNSVKEIAFEFRDKLVDEKLVIAAIRKDKEINKNAGFQEFVHFNPAAFEKIDIGFMELTTDLLFCLKWINCQYLRVNWADNSNPKDLPLVRGIPKIVLESKALRLVDQPLLDTMNCPIFIVEWPLRVGTEHISYGHMARLITEWQHNLREIENFKFEIERDRMQENEILAMVDDVFRLLGTGCKLVNPRRQQQYFLAGITAKRLDSTCSQNAEIGKLCVIWEQEQQDQELLIIYMYPRRTKKPEVV